MDSLLFLIRLALAGVLGVAGIAKLADLPGGRQAMRDFGLPARLAAPLALLLPLAEIGAALLLLPATTAWWGALGAATLLTLFVGGIAFNLAQGRTPNCHCFGQLHSQPIGWPTLLRNSILLLMAALILVPGPAFVGPSLVAWLTELSPLGYAALIGGLLLIALVAGQSWIVFNLLRQNGRLLLRLEAVESHLGLQPQEVAPIQEAKAPRGLPVGSPAPAFTLPSFNGGDVTLQSLLAAGKPLLLLFSSPTCGTCVDLLPEVGQWQRDYADHFTLALINRGELNALRSKIATHELANVLLQQENELAEAYQSTGTPSALLVAADGTIRSPLAAGIHEVRALVQRVIQPPDPIRARLLPRAPIALESPKANTGLAVGRPAPHFQLPNLQGQPVDSEQLHGRASLLLFWNPTCGFCRRMVDDLKAWESQVAERGNDALRLLLISTGSIEANKAFGLHAPILLDQGFATGTAFGARGTPAAVLLDAAGNVASPVTVGAPAVISLLRSHEHAQIPTAQPVAA
jgi:peroxiredoxin/uncharacterized membrane protein YphA (DoxX/SURF4 family)